MKELVKKFWVLGIVLLLAFGLSMFACGGGGDGNGGDDDSDDDIIDDDSADDDSGCDSNHAPALLSVYYILGSDQLTPPVSISSADSANFGIYFEYADEDCNIPGGHFYNKQTLPEESDWEDLGVLPEDLGCSTADSGYIYGFTFSAALDPADYAGQSKWTDICGTESNIMDWEFTVTAK